MTETEYRKRIREFLHDPDGKVWTDEELLSMLEQAAEDYCTDTGFFTGDHTFLVEEGGKTALPDGFRKFIAGWNERGHSITVTSSGVLGREYGQYTGIKGSAIHLYEDTDSIGTATLFPDPEDLQTVVQIKAGTPYYGVMKLTGYGIPTGAASYGTAIRVMQYNSVGEMKYIRLESFEKIRDWTALIWHVLHQAFLEDTDFADTEKAELYLTWYKARIARTLQLSRAPGMIRSRGRYF